MWFTCILFLLLEYICFSVYFFVFEVSFASITTHCTWPNMINCQLQIYFRSTIGSYGGVLKQIRSKNGKNKPTWAMQQSYTNNNRDACSETVIVWGNGMGNMRSNDDVSCFSLLINALGKCKNKFLHKGCPRGVMFKALDCGILVREFVLQLRYYAHLRMNPLGKVWTPWSSQLWLNSTTTVLLKGWIWN